MELRKSEYGVYYWMDYAPARMRHLIKGNEDSLRVIEFKNCNVEEIDAFTIEMINAIVIITQNIRTKKVALVAVPSSKINNKSPMSECLHNIEILSNKGIINEIYKHYDKDIVSAGNLLRRKINMPAAHESIIRPSYEEQYSSIECTRDNLSKEWSTFIIVDDITTTGTIMNVCEEKLLEHGAVKKYIRKLAIARTMRNEEF